MNKTMNKPKSTRGGARKGAGRPKSGRGETLRMYADKELLAKFDRIAAARGLERSAMLRQIVEQEIEHVSLVIGA
jgi:hypothetical protein